MSSHISPILSSLRLYLWIPILGNTLLFGASLGIEVGQALLAGFVLCLIASLAFVTNDLYDRQIDAHNGRTRLAYACRATLRMGIVVVISLALFSLYSASVLHPSLGPLLVALLVVGGTAYTVWLRSVPFVSTLVATALSTSPFWFCMALRPEHISVSHVAILQMAILAFYGREIVLDIGDEGGDRVGGRYTLPVLFGKRLSALVAALLILSSVMRLVYYLSFEQVGSTVGSATLVVLFAILVTCWIIPAVRISVACTRESVARLAFWSRMSFILLPACLFLSWLSTG